MSRSLQILGLTKAANSLVSEECYTHDEQVNKRFKMGDNTYDTEIGVWEPKFSPVYKSEVYDYSDFGSFGCVPLNKYGDKYEEYIQAQPWSSGPMVFLALRCCKTKTPIEGSLWEDKEIEKY